MLLNISDDVKNFVLSDKAEILNPNELISFAEQQIINLSANSTSLDAYKMGDNTDEVLAKRAENPSQIPGLEVGWPMFDEHTNGGQPGDP